MVWGHSLEKEVLGSADHLGRMSVGLQEAVVKVPDSFQGIGLGRARNLPF